MIKIKQNQKLIGKAKSFTEVAKFLEKRGIKGVYWIVSDNISKPMAVKRCDFDGVFTEIEGYGRM